MRLHVHHKHEHQILHDSSSDTSIQYNAIQFYETFSLQQIRISCHSLRAFLGGGGCYL